MKQECQSFKMRDRVIGRQTALDGSYVFQLKSKSSFFADVVRGEMFDVATKLMNNASHNLGQRRSHERKTRRDQGGPVLVQVPHMILRTKKKTQ